MAHETKKLTTRVTADQFLKITQAAHRLGLSTNRYLVTAGLAYDTDSDQTARLLSLVDERLSEATEVAIVEQTQAVEALLDKRYRQLLVDIRSAFDAVKDGGGRA